MAVIQLTGALPQAGKHWVKRSPAVQCRAVSTKAVQPGRGRSSASSSFIARAQPKNTVAASAAVVDRPDDPSRDRTLDTSTSDAVDFEDDYFEPENSSLMIGQLLAGDELTSNSYHRAVCGVAAGLCLGLFASGAVEQDPGQLALSAFAGYLAADILSGVFHWSVDNYGDNTTPLVGGVIAAFQGHHMYPWTITKRECANNLHKVALPTIPALAAMLALPLPASLRTFLSVATAGVVLSQQFHAWSHTRKSQLPAAVVALQDANVLISRKGHGAHHRKPFEGNYCIVSGIWNPLLDNTGFFRWLEKRIHEKNGVAPRCWSEPDYTWLNGNEK